MQQSFIVSYLAFYLKTTIGLEADFVKVSVPNTILKLIPLGAQNKTIPINQISSVDDSFSLDIKSFFWGLVFTFIGLNSLSSNFMTGLIFGAYGALTVLSSFQTVLVLTLTSGQTVPVNVIIFEKANLLSAKETIESILLKHSNDRNLSRFFDAKND